MSRSAVSDLRRVFYKTQRAIGTVQAAGRGPGPLARRMARRKITRSSFGALRRRGLW